MSDLGVDELDKLSGVWIQTQFEENGVSKKSDEYGTQPILTIVGHRFFVMNDAGESLLEGSFSIDPSREPQEIDWIDAVGPDAGKTLLSIYSLDADHFVFCAADPELTRPRHFSSALGHTRRAFTRLERRVPAALQPIPAVDLPTR